MERLRASHIRFADLCDVPEQQADALRLFRPFRRRGDYVRDYFRVAASRVDRYVNVSRI